jgi:hypothetical protein
VYLAAAELARTGMSYLSYLPREVLASTLLYADVVTVIRCRKVAMSSETYSSPFWREYCDGRGYTRLPDDQDDSVVRACIATIWDTISLHHVPLTYWPSEKEHVDALLECEDIPVPCRDGMRRFIDDRLERNVRRHQQGLTRHLHHGMLDRLVIMRDPVLGRRIGATGRTVIIHADTDSVFGRVEDGVPETGDMLASIEPQAGRVSQVTRTPIPAPIPVDVDASRRALQQMRARCADRSRTGWERGMRK